VTVLEEHTSGTPVHPITVVHAWKILVHPGVYDTPGLQTLLYATCRGKRVLVIRFNATFLHLRPYCEKKLNVRMFLERYRKSNNVWLRALMQSDC